jgi:YqfQ-like protein
MLITYKEGGKTVFPRYQQRPMHPPMHSRMAARPFNPYNSYRMTQPMNPMMMRSHGASPGRGGGLLSKLLGQVNQAGASQGFNPLSFGSQQAASGGGLLKSLTNPGTINSFLTNTQKVLSTAQQVGPLVNQYGPIVKNLPMMWKLYRGLKDAPEFNENQDESNVEPSDEQLEEHSFHTDDIDLSDASKNKTSPSKPKLYI